MKKITASFGQIKVSETQKAIYPGSLNRMAKKRVSLKKRLKLPYISRGISCPECSP